MRPHHTLTLNPIMRSGRTDSRPAESDSSREAVRIRQRWMHAVTLCFVLSSAVRAEPSLSERIAAAMSPLPHTQTAASAYIVNLETNEIVFEHDGDAPLVPASNAKVFVMATALAGLGENFAFETVLATDGQKLYLIGSGDPALGDPKLAKERGDSPTTAFEKWGQSLVSAGMTSFPDGLCVDASALDGEFLHTSWEEDDLGKWYSAPVGGVNFHNNVVNIKASPGPEPGTACAISVFPETNLVEIVNRCRTGEQADPTLHHPAGTRRYMIRGRCRKEWPFPPVAFAEPGLLTGDVLKSVLSRSGVQVGGDLVECKVRLEDGRIPPNLTVLATHQSPMADLMRRTGADSQNLYAECLLKRLGFEAQLREKALLPHGSWRNGTQEAMTILKGAGIDVKGLVLDDGSGLSRNNRCTARQLVEVHRWTNKLPGASLYRSSLAEPGEAGSLRKRMKDASEAVRAKTGTMMGVSTLSGFIDGPNGEHYAFALMFNNYPGSSRPYKEIQDKVCRILAGVEP